jgi:cell volume regulation protein A
MKPQIELILLGMSVLFLMSIFAGKASSKFGVPALLLFLSVGMLTGTDGLGIEFEDIHFAQNIGTVALCIILFSGGLDTRITEIRPVISQGVILATIGVMLTALLTGLAVWALLGMTADTSGISLLTALLLAATMSSTDSASVFSILRSKGLHLKNNLRPMLELESGSNDPMAYVLVVTLIGIINMGTAPNYWLAGGTLLLQLAVGAVAGYAVGKLAVHIINHIRIENASLYPILVFTFCILIFSLTYFLKGNGFLAVYIGGLVIGNAKLAHKRSSLNFFDGLAWMSQLFLFLTLGLLVNPRELIPVLIPGLVISFIMIFVTRPLTVFLCLAPFRKMPVRDKTFVSWVGLRGAVPIVFAILPLAAEVPHARFIFNIVFLCTLVSLLVQGTTLPRVAQLLGLAEKPVERKKLEEFDVEFSGDIKTITSELVVTSRSLEIGKNLMDLPLPEKTLVVMIKRDDIYFVPTGKTPLHENDRLLVITESNEALAETYKALGVD